MRDLALANELLRDYKKIQPVILEQREKLSLVKSSMIDLVEKADKKHFTKEHIRDELFKLYMEIK